MNTCPIIPCTVFVAAVMAGQWCHAAEDEVRVTVAVTAAPEYVGRRAATDVPPEETYVIGRGDFFPGTGADGALAEVAFDRIVRQLSLGLAEQGYLPVKDGTIANLLITVHWGVTKPVAIDRHLNEDLVGQTEEFLANQNPDPLLKDYGRLNELSSRADTLAGELDRGIIQNAGLLGYLPALAAEQEQIRKSAQGDRQPALYATLAQERFFVILLAWDNQQLRASQEKRLLWSARCSARARGHGFSELLPMFAAVGGRYFGRHLDALKTHRVSIAGRTE